MGKRTEVGRTNGWERDWSATAGRQHVERIPSGLQGKGREKLVESTSTITRKRN